MRCMLSLSKVPPKRTGVGCAIHESKVVLPLSVVFRFAKVSSSAQTSLLTQGGIVCVCVSPPQDPCITSTVTAQKRILRPGRKFCLVQPRNHRSNKILLPSPASISSRC